MVHALPAVDSAMVHSVAVLLAAPNKGDIALQVRLRTGDSMLAKRLTACIPEAFAMVLVSHHWNIQLPTHFQAQKRDGRWLDFELRTEPIFAVAVQLASALYHDGDPVFRAVAAQSAMLAALSEALHANAEVEGASFPMLTLGDVPAEAYLEA